MRMSSANAVSRTKDDAARAMRAAVLSWFRRHGRDLPWRRTADPWRILVSEVMLQQTQVDRVVPKYEAFVGAWPTPAALAAASPAEVLAAWSGLGYNRRALNLWRAAGEIVRRYGGAVPVAPEELATLPGIGEYTSRAVAAFAANADVRFWDTNVRRVVLRYFRGGEFARVPSSAAALERLLDVAPRGRSREWHGALMDLGSAICASRDPRCADCPLMRGCKAAPSFLAGKRRRFAFSRPQARFEGSDRQARGEAVRLLVRAGRAGMDERALASVLGARGRALIERLVAEGLVVRRGRRVTLP